jgi:hypothetical protein
MALDYETVGEFYATLGQNLQRFVEAVGEDAAFCGDPALQLSPSEIDLEGAKPVVCLKTALAAFDAIVVQGEGAPDDAAGSHYQKFAAIRAEYGQLLAANGAFVPGHPAATNPRPEGRVWIEDDDAVATVDLANAAYGLMLRLLAHSYALPAGAEKALSIDLAIGLMRAVAPLGERADRDVDGARRTRRARRQRGSALRRQPDGRRRTRRRKCRRA